MDTLVAWEDEVSLSAAMEISLRRGCAFRKVLAGEQFLAAESASFSLPAINQDFAWLFAIRRRAKCFPFPKTGQCQMAFLNAMRSPAVVHELLDFINDNRPDESGSVCKRRLCGRCFFPKTETGRHIVFRDVAPRRWQKNLMVLSRHQSSDRENGLSAGRVRARRSLRSLRRLLWSAALLMAGYGLVHGADEPALGFQMKAGFLANLPKYVNWPEATFTNAESSIVIGVMGESKVAGEVEKIIKDRKINGRGLTLKRISSVDQADGCQILFIPSEERSRMIAVLENLKHKSVLTVGESDDFLAIGGMINLTQRERNISLEVNLAPVGEAHLKISSKLLNVASLVKGKSK